MSRSPVRVVAVSDDALRSKLLDVLSDDGNSHNVICVESLASAYRRIRQLVPELIVVLMRIDDEEACRVLTMLEVDRELYGIPVVMWAVGDSESQTDPVIGSPVPVGYCDMAHA